MKEYIIDFVKLLVKAYKEWVKDRAQGLAASICYYELLSYAPLIGFILFISFKIFGVERTTEEVIPILKIAFPEQFLNVLKFMLLETRKMKPWELSELSLLAGLMLGFATLEYYAQIKDSIEAIWDQRIDKPGILDWIRRLYEDIKATLITLIIIIFFLMIRVLLPHPFVTGDQELPFFDQLLITIARIVFGGAFMFSLSLYWFMFFPPVTLGWKEVVPGACMAAFLQIIGREIMKNYMYRNADAGLAESIVVVLIWFYYSNLVLIYSAEFSKVYILKKRGVELSSFSLTSAR